MKLLIISTQVIATPPPSYGGLEVVVWNHAKGLADLGEDVTLIAAKGSKAPPNVELLEIEKPGEFGVSEERAFWHYKHLLNNYDVILDHSWSKWSMLSGDSLPVIGTMHSPLPFKSPPPKKYPMLCGVSAQHSLYASKMLMDDAGRRVPVRTTWNSVDMSLYPYVKERGDYFLSVNRMDPNKGIHVFTDWCKRAGVKGKIIGDDKMIIQDKNYPEHIKKQCAESNGLIEYVGLASHEDKVKAMQGCRAVVLLPQLPNYLEVFGLAAVEVMACGKPVLCTSNCGLLDINENGQTGFFVDTYEQFVGATRAVDSIDPETCRKRAEKFSIEAITPKYRDMILKVAAGCRW